MTKMSNWKSKNQPDIFIPTQKMKKIVQYFKLSAFFIKKLWLR